jgi:hypothetical protein
VAKLQTSGPCPSSSKPGSGKYGVYCATNRCSLFFLSNFVLPHRGLVLLFLMKVFAYLKSKYNNIFVNSLNTARVVYKKEKTKEKEKDTSKNSSNKNTLVSTKKVKKKKPRENLLIGGLSIGILEL